MLTFSLNDQASSYCPDLPVKNIIDSEICNVTQEKGRTLTHARVLTFQSFLLLQRASLIEDKTSIFSKHRFTIIEVINDLSVVVYRLILRFKNKISRKSAITLCFDHLISPVYLYAQFLFSTFRTIIGTLEYGLYFSPVALVTPSGNMTIMTFSGRHCWNMFLFIGHIKVSYGRWIQNRAAYLVRCGSARVF